MRRALILVAWVPTRLLFLALWALAVPVGQAQAWLATEWRRG